MPICHICDAETELKTEVLPDGRTRMLNGVKFKDRVIVWCVECGGAMMIGFYGQRYVRDEKVQKILADSRRQLKEGALKIKSVPEEFVIL